MCQENAGRMTGDAFCKQNIVDRRNRCCMKGTYVDSMSWVGKQYGYRTKYLTWGESFCRVLRRLGGLNRMCPDASGNQHSRKEILDDRSELCVCVFFF